MATPKDAIGGMTPAIVWDEEERAELMSVKEGHIRDTTMYITAPLWADMVAAWGGVVTHIKTATNLESGAVSLFKAKKTEKGAVPVRLVGALNAAEFSFFRPLRKLNIKVPADRQYNVTPTTQEIQGLGTLFVFPLSERKSVPRNRGEEAASQSSGQAAPGTQPAGAAETK